MNKKKGPWVVTDTKVVYQNPWISVREDQVIRPDKKPGIFGVVTQKAGVSVIAMDDQNNVYLTKEYHYAVERVMFEAVSGGIDTDETKLQAAKRELREEAGLVAKKWTDLGMIDPFTSVIKSSCNLYLAQGLTKVDDNQEGTETIKIVKLPFKKVLDMVLNSDITHGASVVAILKINERLRDSKR